MNGLSECSYLCATGTTVVDDDERVVIIGSDCSFRLAFVADKLDKLTGREFECDAVVGEIGIVYFVSFDLVEFQ